MNNTLHTKHEFGIHLPHETINGWRHPATRVTTAALIAAGAIGSTAPCLRQAALGVESLLDELENSFWVGDYAATIDIIDFNHAISCSPFTEALKKRKFDDDFNAMLAWWQQHKEAKHLKRSKNRSASAPRSAPSTPR